MSEYKLSIPAKEVRYVEFSDYKLCSLQERVVLDDLVLFCRVDVLAKNVYHKLPQQDHE